MGEGEGGGYRSVPCSLTCFTLTSHQWHSCMYASNSWHSGGRGGGMKGLAMMLLVTILIIFHDHHVNKSDVWCLKKMLVSCPVIDFVSSS